MDDLASDFEVSDTSDESEDDGVLCYSLKYLGDILHFWKIFMGNFFSVKVCFFYLTLGLVRSGYNSSYGFLLFFLALNSIYNIVLL